MSTTTFDSYFDFLSQLGQNLEQMTELTQEKIAAVRAKDLHKLDACMRKEQVFSLSLRSMDIKRDKMLKELGLSGVPLSGLTAHCPEEYRLRAKQVTETLQNQFACYQGAAEVSRTLLECNLHEIEKRIGTAPASVAGPSQRPSGSMTDIRA